MYKVRTQSDIYEDLEIVVPNGTHGYSDMVPLTPTRAKDEGVRYHAGKVAVFFPGINKNVSVFRGEIITISVSE